MINLCYGILCIGANLWKVYCLCIIFDLCMDTDLFFFGIQSLKCYKQGIFQCETIKYESYINSSVGGFRYKCGFCCYFLIVYQDRLTCCLIH